MDLSCPRNAWPRPCCQGSNVKLKNSFDGSDSTAGVMMMMMMMMMKMMMMMMMMMTMIMMMTKLLQ